MVKSQSGYSYDIYTHTGNGGHIALSESLIVIPGPLVNDIMILYAPDIKWYGHIDKWPVHVHATYYIYLTQWGRGNMTVVVITYVCNLIVLSPSKPPYIQWIEWLD